MVIVHLEEVVVVEQVIQAIKEEVHQLEMPEEVHLKGIIWEDGLIRIEIEINEMLDFLEIDHLTNGIRLETDLAQEQRKALLWMSRIQQSLLKKMIQIGKLKINDRQIIEVETSQTLVINSQRLKLNKKDLEKPNLRLLLFNKLNWSTAMSESLISGIGEHLINP